jgi:hypothetical protein
VFTDTDTRTDTNIHTDTDTFAYAMRYALCAMQFSGEGGEVKIVGL